MEKFKRSYVFLIMVVLLFVIILFYQGQCRIVSMNIKSVNDMIYVPSGIANNYKNLLTFSIDEHIIWEYKLNSSEIQKMEQDLEKNIWNRVTSSDIKEIEYFFMYNFESYWPDDISNNLYYCLYDFSLKKFLSAHNDSSIIGWHKALFVYDVDNARYYCVSKSI